MPKSTNNQNPTYRGGIDVSTPPKSTPKPPKAPTVDKTDPEPPQSDTPHSE